MAYLRLARSRILVVVVLVVILVGLLSTATARASDTAPRTLPGHVLRNLSTATDLGPTPSDEQITLTVALQPRSVTDLQAAVAQARARGSGQSSGAAIQD